MGTRWPHSRESQLKKAVTVTEMAAMVRLSRSRFNQLLGPVFPPPVYDPRTHRPYFTESQQRVILDLRRTNCGTDGKPVLFYAKRSTPAAANAKSAKNPRSPSDRSRVLTELQNGVSSLGLRAVRREHLEDVLRQLYPAGIGETVMGDLVRSVFLELVHRATSGPVGR